MQTITSQTIIELIIVIVLGFNVVWLGFLVAVVALYATHKGAHEVANTTAKGLTAGLQQALGLLKKE